MQLYRYLSISLLLIFVCNAAIRPKNNVNSNNKKHAIIIDITNVLFKENQNEFAKKIGYGVLASYAITHWKNPGYRCLDMLAAISKNDVQKPHVVLTLKGRILPRCLVELHEGTKNCAQVKTEIAQSIETLEKTKFFGSAKEKQLMLAIMNLILDPLILATITEPIKHMVQLVQKLKRAGHPCYICANAPEELYASIEKSHPDIIGLFDGIVISSRANELNPFSHLVTTHNLNPQDCIVINDLEANVAAAKALGMDGIVHDKISHVTNKLRKCGIKI
jgi:HAD superfamily hydrolase (TIGR01509 family)